METFYRILGLSAGLSQRLSRVRGNGIPLNWLLMIALGIVGGASLFEVRESLVNPGKPPDVNLATLVGRAEMEDRYIRTHGQFVLDAGLALQKSDKSTEPEKLYIPLIDVATRSAMYVEVDPDPARKPADMDARHVSGMVRKLDRRLSDQLGKTTQKFADIPIDTTYMIVAGDRPARAWIWIPIAAVLGLFVLLLLLPILKRYVVFRRAAEPQIPDSDAAPQPAGSIRVTGVFSLPPSARHRFHNIPAVIAELEGGMMGLVTQADASTRVMGAVTEKRSGMWLIPIRSGTLGEPEFGRYYFGGAAYPAFRIRYTDDGTGKNRWAILAFDSVHEMRAAWSALRRTSAGVQSTS